MNIKNQFKHDIMKNFNYQLPPTVIYTHVNKLISKSQKHSAINKVKLLETRIYSTKSTKLTGYNTLLTSATIILRRSSERELS